MHVGYKHTPKAIEKIREAGKRRIGMKFSQEHCRNISLSKSKENNPRWNKPKPNATYRAIHLWLRAKYGNPDHCENKYCVYPRKNQRGKLMTAPSRFEWALKRGKEYSRNKEDYLQLCTSCHGLYDHNRISI